jgi:hypothetical protein
LDASSFTNIASGYIIYYPPAGTGYGGASWTGLHSFPYYAGATYVLGADYLTVTLSADATYGTILSVSNNAAYTMTFDLKGKSLTATTSVTASTRGIISSSVAGAKIESGDITVAANGTLTEANITQIKSSGNVDLSAGTYTPSTARWILTGLGKTLKLAAGHKLYDLITTGTSDIRLSANATVSNELVMASRINPLTYTLTHEAPDKLYDQRRMHYEVLHEPVQTEQGRADMILGYLTGRANMEI